MTDNIYWIIKLNIGEGNIQAIKDLAPAFIEKTKQEEGALAYEWSVSADGSELHVYERYADSDAALAHLGNVGPMLPELFALASPITIEVYGSASDVFKEAVKDFPTNYHSQFDGFSR